MSGLPEVGDLAIVIQEHCGAAGLVGLVVEVSAVLPPHPTIHLICSGCGAKYAHETTHALMAGRKLYHPQHWLKRLPSPKHVRLYDESWKNLEPVHVGKPAHKV